MERYLGKEEKRNLLEMKWCIILRHFRDINQVVVAPLFTNGTALKFRHLNYGAGAKKAAHVQNEPKWIHHVYTMIVWQGKFSKWIWNELCR